MKLHFDNGERQIPLHFRLDTHDRWGEVQEALGLERKEHAPVAWAIYENTCAGHATSYSRRNSRGGKGDCNGLLSRRNVIGCIDRLGALALVDNMVQCPGGRGWRSAARGTSDLADILNPIIPDLGTRRLLMPKRYAIIRDENGNEIEPKNRAEFEQIERAVAPINEMIEGTDIRDGKGIDIRTPMRRVFTGDTEHNGRLYGIGGVGWMNMTRGERHDITINGDPTIEPDFTALHPHLLYERRGHIAPIDCYDVGNWPRDLVKLALLVLINAKTLKDVVNVLANSDGEKILRDEDGCVIDVTTERTLMKQIAGEDYSKAMAYAHTLIKDVKKKHHLIADDFHSGAGLWLMKKDAEIAMHIIRSMNQMGEPVLSIHDSFRVRVSMKDKLEEVMLEAAHSAGLFGIKIKAKTRH